MNDVYKLSKRRFKNELSDKEMRLERRRVLETQYGYRAHLSAVGSDNDSDDANTVVPAPPSTSKQPAANKDCQETKAEAKSSIPPIRTSDKAPSVPSSTAAPIYSEKPASEARQQSQVTAPKLKLMPIAAVVVVALGVSSYFLIPSSEPEYLNDTSTSAPQQVDLNEQFSAIVEQDSYSDQSFNLFLNFWPLADEQQKAAFLAELDEKILDLDPEISDRLVYLQSLIRQSESELVRQTKAIINGAQDNAAFSQLSRAWNNASSSEKNVYIEFISSTYQDSIVDFDNEENTIVVEAILSQLDITSSVKSVDNSPPTQPVAVKPASSEALPAERITAATEQAIDSASDSKESMSPELEQSDAMASDLKAPISKAIDDAEAEVKETSTESLAQVKDALKDPNPAQTSAPVTPTIATVVPEATVKQPDLSPQAAPLIAQDSSVDEYTARINQLLSMPSLRNPEDSKLLAETTRELYKVLSQQYTEQGVSDAKQVARNDTFKVFEQHERFAHHYYDVELFFTDLNNTEIQADVKTQDAMKALNKLFNNAATPARPPEA